MNETSASVNQEQNVSPACIRDIFSQGHKINRLGEYCNVFPGVTFVRNQAKIAYARGNSKNEAGLKKPITTFSDKSRRKMMVTLAMIEEPPKCWQDFTFADDVMKDKTIAQKALFSSTCMKYFKQEMERVGLKIHGIWKREWVSRKSGRLMGEYIPHFHVVFTLPGMDRKTYEFVIKKLAEMWVKITGTTDVTKALAVALHEKSSRFIDSRKQMQKYMSKYLAKLEDFHTTDSIGRSWGRIGCPKIAQGEVIGVTEHEMALLKRCLRKMTRRAKGRFKILLKDQYTKFFIFIDKLTIIKYIEWIRANENFEGVPF